MRPLAAVTPPTRVLVRELARRYAPRTAGLDRDGGGVETAAQWRPTFEGHVDFVESRRGPAASAAAVAAVEAAATSATATGMESLRALDACARSGGLPALLSLCAGWNSDRMAWAFAGGYQAALRSLLDWQCKGRRWQQALDAVGEASDPGVMSFCFTEDGHAGRGGGAGKGKTGQGKSLGRGVAGIRTEISADGLLGGEKSFVTLSTEADSLVVVAVDRRAEAQVVDRPGFVAVRAVMVPARQGAGVTVIESNRKLPFCSEVSHSRVSFQGTPVGDFGCLPGCGWETYTKPFRSVEDVHVCLSVGAFVLKEAVKGAGAGDSGDVGVEAVVEGSRTLQALCTSLDWLRALALHACGLPGDGDAAAEALTDDGVFAGSPAHSLLLGSALPHFDRSVKAVIKDFQLGQGIVTDSQILDVAGAARAARLQKALQWAMPAV